MGCIVIYRDTIRQGTNNRKPAFRYTYASNRRTVSSSVLKKIQNIYVPHSWTKVEIYFNHPKLIATGELNGEIRYLYKKQYTEKQHKRKYKRLYDFGKKLPFIKKDIIRQLTTKGPSYKKVIATALWFLYVSYIRVGNERYMKENNTHGLLTLKKKHITLTPSKIKLNFVGKKNVKNVIELDIPSPSFGRWLRYLYDHARPFVFHYDGKRVNASDINHYIQDHYGNFTAKDFRTWGANIELLSAIRRVNPKTLKTKRDAQRVLREAIEHSSKKLNNTISVCKSNYLCKTILEKYNKNPVKMIQQAKKSRSIPKLLLEMID